MAIYSNRIVISVSKIKTMLNITNSQSTPTQPGLQVMWQVPVSTLYTHTIGCNSKLSNLRFAYNGQFVPAWLESINNGTATIWIKMPVSIPANSSITLNLYSNSTLNFDGAYWGEAPQLSSTYGQYDNGGSVFNNYWNFSGTSTPSGINVYTGYGSVTFNNGVIIKGGTTQLDGYNGIATSSTFSPPIIFDYYGTQSTSPSGDSWGWNSAGFYNYFGSYPWRQGTYTTLNFENGVNAASKTDQGGTSTNGGLSTPSNNLFPKSVWTHIYTSSTYYTYQNYINSTGYITGASNTASLNFGIGVGANEATYVPGGMTVYYLRSRAYPPNGVMPTVRLI